MPLTKQLVVLLIIAGLIFTGFGYFILPKIIGQNISSGQNTFAAGLQAAYNRLVARGRSDVALFGYGYAESKIIVGKITEIKDGQISLQVYPVNPLADPQLDERIIKLDGSTKIYRKAEKTPEQIKQEQENYIKQTEELNKKMQENKTVGTVETLPPPTSFGKEEIKPADLKVGDQIMITANNDIHAAKEFKAEEIMLQVKKQ